VISIVMTIKSPDKKSVRQKSLTDAIYRDTGRFETVVHTPIIKFNLANMAKL